MEKLILECVLRSALVAGGTSLALWLFHVRAARVRHAIWASVVVLMLALPSWTIWGPKAVLRVLTPTPVTVTASVSEASHATQTWNEEAVTVTTVRKISWTLADSLLTLYLAGLSLLLLRLLIGTVRARLLVLRAARVDGLLTSESCASPVTVGWLRPSVILPTSWKSWTPSQLTAVLVHEDEHARRRDPLVQWLALMNRAVFWFHPLAWWLERRLSSLAEEACDDAVLLLGHDPLDYSECLLGMAQVVRDSGMRLSAVGMAMPGVSLPQRIRRIAAGASVERVSRVRMIGTAAACAVIAILCSTTAVGYAISVPAITAASKATTRAPIPATPEVKAFPATPVVLAQAVGTPPSLSGIVKDPSGAVVPNASVTLTNAYTNAVIATVTTDETGKYFLGDLDPGIYNATIRVPGFKTATQTGIRIAANDTHDGGTISLQLGVVSQSLSVTTTRSASASPTVLGPMTTLSPSRPMTMTPANTAVNTPKALPLSNDPQSPQNSGPKPQRIGGMVTPTNVIWKVVPPYPPTMRSAGVQGTVKFEAIIGKDGTLHDLQTVSSPDPGFTQAAFDSVKQWRFKPTTLNGEPVETMTTIDVNFALQD